MAKENSIELLPSLELKYSKEITEYPPSSRKYNNNKRILERGDFLGNYGIRFLQEVDYLNDTFKDKPIPYSKGKHKVWCQCGLDNKPFVARLDSLDNNSIKSCGCRKHFTSTKNVQTMIEKRPPVWVDITNKTFGALTAKYITNKRDGDGCAYWFCECNCGGSRLATYKDLKKGHIKYCPQCSKARQAINHIGEKYGKLTITKILFEENKRGSNGGLFCHVKCDCGRERDIPLNFLLRKNGQQSCGLCECSKGELYIATVLENHDILFFSQYIFEDCINPETNTKLRFDFYLPDYNTCIEYDGEQHFFPIDYFGGENGLKENQYRDNIKNNYCRKNNINLVRIPYFDKEKICWEYLEKRGCFE